MIEIALHTATIRKYAIFPLHSVNPSQKICSCGDPNCENQGKHPRTDHGLDDASSNPDQIRQWWGRWDNANIGIPCGKNYIAVLDIDPRHNGDKSLAKLQEIYGKLPDTFTVKTGGNGLHFYFSRFAGEKLKSVSNALGPDYPGIDLKAQGGYVIGAGSLHLSGNRYEIINDVPLVDIPEWLEKLLLNQGKSEIGTRKEPFKLPDTIPGGQRNQTLVSFASSLRAKGADEGEILAGLQAINRRCTPPYPDNELKAIAANRAKKDILPDYQFTGFKYPDSLYHWGIKSVGRGENRTEINLITGLEHPAVIIYLRDRLNTISFSDRIFIYDNGVYRPNAHDIESIITDLIHDRKLTISETKEHREFKAALLGMNRFLEFPFNRHTDALPVKNGILKLNFIESKAELIPYSPDYKFTFKIPVDYDPALSGDEFHKKVISEYIDSDSTDVLYQIPATALLQALGKSPYKKSYIIQGEADGGKTTYLSWLHSLLGIENIGHASLQQIGIDTFVFASLESRLLNTFDDLPDIPLQNIGAFKALTGGYDHTINQKQQPRYNGRIFCVHVFTANAPPEVPEKILYDSAFWSRWEYLHFDNIFIVDPDFKQRYFTPENLSGSFNRVLITMFKIAKDGLIVNDTPSEVKDIWQTASDPFAMFIRDNMISLTTEHTFNKDHLFNSLREYCQEREINERKIPSTQKAFSTLVFKNGFKDAYRGPKTNREKVYTAFRDWNPSSKYREAKS